MRTFLSAVSVGLVFSACALSLGCSSREGEPTPVPTPPTSVTAVPTRSSTALPSATAATPTQVPSTPTPRPTATPDAVGQLVEHGPRTSRLVGLTFDMGGRVDPALDIMNWLVANQVPATIFITGATAESPNTDAGREVLRIVAAHPALFDLGNHSYSHPDFRDLTPAQIASELARTEDAISASVDVSARPWFRPPFGGVDSEVVAAVAQHGYPRTIMWDVDTIDWRPEADGGPTAGEIVTKVVSGAQGGSIVLMHLGGYNTFAALDGIVSGLRARGLQPAKLSDMLE